MRTFTRFTDVFYFPLSMLKPTNNNLQSPWVDDLESSASVCNYAPSISLPAWYLLNPRPYSIEVVYAIKQFSTEKKVKLKQ